MTSWRAGGSPAAFLPERALTVVEPPVPTKLTREPAEIPFRSHSNSIPRLAGLKVGINPIQISDVGTNQPLDVGAPRCNAHRGRYCDTDSARKAMSPLPIAKLAVEISVRFHQRP